MILSQHAEISVGTLTANSAWPYSIQQQKLSVCSRHSYQDTEDTEWQNMNITDSIPILLEKTRVNKALWFSTVPYLKNISFTTAVEDKH